MRKVGTNSISFYKKNNNLKIDLLFLLAAIIYTSVFIEMVSLKLLVTVVDTQNVPIYRVVKKM